MENIIEINHLCKSFGSVHAVNDLSFRVKPGELFAFLGVNGAGKSTTISMLCGQLKRDSGEIIVDGKNLSESLDEIKSELGIVFQSSVLDKQLSVIDNLKCRAALYGITGRAFERRIAELDSLLELKELLKRPLGKLSGGQRRRIDIARAILHKPKILILCIARALLKKPKILILDEPTTGLDPQTRKSVWAAIESLQKSEDMTVFLTTHYMEEAAVADYVVILESGKIAAEGTPIELKNKYTGDFITLYGCSDEAAETLNVPFERDGDNIRIAVEDTSAATRLIVSHPEVFCDYEIVKGRMDDVFLAVTGHKAQQ